MVDRERAVCPPIVSLLKSRTGYACRNLWRESSGQGFNSPRLHFSFFVLNCGPSLVFWGLCSRSAAMGALRPFGHPALLSWNIRPHASVPLINDRNRRQERQPLPFDRTRSGTIHHDRAGLTLTAPSLLFRPHARVDGLFHIAASIPFPARSRSRLAIDPLVALHPQPSRLPRPAFAIHAFKEPPQPRSPPIRHRSRPPTQAAIEHHSSGNFKPHQSLIPKHCRKVGSDRRPPCSGGLRPSGSCSGVL